MSAHSILQFSEFVFGFPLLVIGSSLLPDPTQPIRTIALGAICLFFIIAIGSLNRHFCPRSPARCWITLFWLSLIFTLIPGAILTHIPLLPLVPVIIAGCTLFTLGILVFHQISEAD